LPAKAIGLLLVIPVQGRYGQARADLPTL